MPKKSLSVPTPRRLPSGKWFIQMRLGGQSYSVTAATEKECIRQATLIKSQYKSGQLQKSTTVNEPTIGELIDKRIESIDGVLSPTTVYCYINIRKNRFKSIMNKTISQVSDWQEVINSELTICSQLTVKTSFKYLCCAMNYTPKVIFPQIIKKEKDFLQPEQIPAFIDAVRGTKIEVAALFGLHGLRRSEICGLKWKDVDLSKNTIHVNGAIVRGADGYVEKEANKNKTSNRYVPILIPRLKELLVNSDKSYEHVVNLTYGAIHYHLTKIYKENGFPEIGVHGLRHSFASLCYHLGLSEKVTMKLGGWASASVMNDIYTHLADMDIASSTEKLASFFSANENANKPENP